MMNMKNEQREGVELKEGWERKKEECGEEEKMEGGGSWHEQELTGEKMSM